MFLLQKVNSEMSPPGIFSQQPYGKKKKVVTELSQTY